MSQYMSQVMMPMSQGIMPMSQGMMPMSPTPQLHPVHKALTSGEVWTERILIAGSVCFFIVLITVATGFGYTYEHTPSKGIVAFLFTLSLMIALAMFITMVYFLSQFRAGSPFLAKVFGNIVSSIGPENMQGHLLQASRQLEADGQYKQAQFGLNMAEQHAAYYGQPGPLGPPAAGTSGSLFV